MDKVMASLARVATLVVVAAGLAACSTYPKTFSNESPIANFGGYQTYSFDKALGTDGDKEVRSLLTQYLIAEISEQMRSRGYVYQEEGADISFNFDLITQEKIRSQPSAAAGGFYGPGAFGYPYAFGYPGFYPGFGYGYGGLGYPGVGWGAGWGGGQRIIQYTEGSLYVSMIDNATRGVVWEGISVSRINDEVLENLGLSIRNAINGIFEQFPYSARGVVRPAMLEQPADATTG